MRRRRHKRINRLPVFCITAIISLSLIGVGYGMWNDGLNVDVNINTGNVDLTSSVDSEFGDLIIDSSDDGKTIYFSGEVYQDFKEHIEIKVLDTGTVPLELKEVKEVNTSEIAELNQQIKARYGLFSIIKDDVIGEFNLNISPPTEDISEDMMMQRSVFSMQDIAEEEDEIQRKINSIYEEINELQSEIDKLNVTEDYKFEYILHFIQRI